MDYSETLIEINLPGFLDCLLCLFVYLTTSTSCGSGVETGVPPL